MPALHRNPLIWREWRIFSRPGKLWGSLIALFGLLFLGYLFISMNQRCDNVPVDRRKVFHDFSLFVLAIQIFAAFYVSLGMTLDSIVMEKSRNAYEFLVTLPISASDKTIGLCFGTTIMPLTVLVLLTPVGFLSGLAGGLEPGNLLWLYALIFTGFAAFSLAGVAASNGLGKFRGAWILVLVFFGFSISFMRAVQYDDFTAVPALTLSPYSLFLASVVDSSDLADVFNSGNYHFYSFEAPWQICPFVFYLFLAGLSYATAVQRLSKPSGRPLPRWAVMAAFGLFQFLLTGFLADTLRGCPGGCIEVVMVYFVSFFIIILFWTMFSIPEYGRLMEWVEKKRYWPVRLLSESFSDIRTPTFVPTAVLWLLTAGTVICIDLLYWDVLNIPALLLIALIWLIYIWAYQTLFLLGCQLVRKSGNMIGALFIAVAIAVPLVFMNIRGLESLIHATPFGLISDDVSIRDYLLYATPVPKEMYISLIWAVGQLVVFGLISAGRFRAMLAISPLGKRVK